ncbi:Oligopeptide transporter 7 isoform 1 [Capsicum annuum]|nr:Oligopeptide transporter 7 isoform 1 [Capsicum annuum]
MPNLLKPGYSDCLEEIETDIRCKLERVCWLPNFYHLPPDVRIASSKAYQEGKIYGIDAASGAAVSALDISVGDHVLDLCAAPGAKLCMMLDILGSSGSVTGVDIAKHRLAACRTMLQKYGLGDHCRLFVADGTSFSLLPVRVHSVDEFASGEKSEVYREWKSRRPWKERKKEAIAKEKGVSKLFSPTQEPELIFYGRFSGVVGTRKNELYQKKPISEVLQLGYDKVLVDAECTHDGSIKHVQKFEQWGWTTFQRRVLDAERTDDLTVLQVLEALPTVIWFGDDFYCGMLGSSSFSRHLDMQLVIMISNQCLDIRFGIMISNQHLDIIWDHDSQSKILLKGGFEIPNCDFKYFSSLTFAQNEDVVEQFLSENTSAELLEITAAENWPCKSGRIQKTLRFDPLTSCTSGLFVAKFTKLAI